MLILSLITFLNLPVYAEEPQVQTLKTLQQNQSEYERRWNMKPVPTRRARFLRFLGEDLSDPTWTPLYIHRFLTKGESTEIRIALLDLIVRSGGKWKNTMQKQFSLEENAEVRGAIIDRTKRLSSPDARQLIQLGTKDTSAIVRRAAMRAIGNHFDLPFSKELVAALQDSDLDVRRFAIRSIGWRKEITAQSELIKVLSDKNATLRFRALYALHKINAPIAVQQVRTLALDQDPDKKISRFAKKIAPK